MLPLACLALAAGVVAQAAEAEAASAPAKACPGMAAWEALRGGAPAQPPTDSMPASHPELRDQLLAMVRDDQAVRNQFIGPGKPALDQNPDGQAHVQQVDDRNLAALYKLIADYGLPTRALVGADGMKAFWLLVQHASTDLTLQKRVLGVIATGDSGIPPDQVALLDDRIAVAEGRPQKYGSQFHFEGGELVPSPIDDETHLDQRRAQMGLPPFSDYKCALQQIYSGPQG
jgi:hypothetical protein